MYRLPSRKTTTMTSPISFDDMATDDLAVLWDIVHELDNIYDFDSTMSSEDLIEDLKEIINLEAHSRTPKLPS